MALLSLGRTLSEEGDNIRRTGARRPGDTAPNGAVIGDLWYDTVVSTLKVWNGSAWVPVGGSAVSSWELNDQTLFLRADTDLCHRIKFATGTQGDLGSMDGVAVMGNGRSALFANSCGGGSWRLAWDTSGDNVFIRSHLSIAPDGSHITDPESITLAGNSAGSLSGISMRSRSNINIRWVMYPDSDQLKFWRDGSERAWILEDGSIVSAIWDTNSKTMIGRWSSNGAYGGLFLDQRKLQNNQSYLHMGSASDDNTFITCNSGGSSGAGCIFFRLGNNGETVMTVGSANNDLRGVQRNICLGIPQNLAGTPVNWATGSSQIGVNISSEKVKKDIRTLKDTPELDAGENSPIFKLRPVRFLWKQQTNLDGDGVVNADDINAIHPNGVAGLIAEEVREVCSDAVHVIPARDEWHWQEGDPLPESDEDGNPVIYRQALPEKVLNVDYDRMLAYLIDAVQHVKEELDSSKETIKNLKDEITTLKKGKN